MANMQILRVFAISLVLTFFLCCQILTASEQPTASNNSTGETPKSGSNESQQEQTTTSAPQTSTQVINTNRTRSSSNKQSRARQSNRKSNRSPSEFVNYQRELINLLGYNNTPPNWLTHTRDFLIDLAQHEPGDKLFHLLAIDGENDTLEYSLRPAPAPDASIYLTIDSATGDVRLRGTPSVSDLKPGLYHLNVEASDGRYPSILELHVYLFNSADMLPDDWSQLKAQMSASEVETTFRNKTEQLYGAIIKSLSGGANLPANLVLPNYVNPGLVPATSSPTANDQDTSTNISPNQASNKSFPQETATAYQRRVILQARTNAQPNFETTPRSTTTIRTPVQELVITAEPLPQDRLLIAPHEQPALMSLVAILSATLVVTLVLLLFVVPMSVKRLRQRLKVVESRHEQLSQQNSHGSSMMTGSDACSSQLGPNSLSCFTLNSATNRSACCRNLMEDTVNTSFKTITNELSEFKSINQSTLSIENARFRCLNNGAIRNPLHCEQLLNEVPPFDQQLNNSSVMVERIYDNIEGDDDGFYSTLNPVVANSPTCSEDSTRSLARFLSLPARHSSNQKQVCQTQTNQQIHPNSNDLLAPVPPKKSLFALSSKVSSSRSGACTIARATQVALEQANKWEIDRHRLKFLEILDTGQFGLVWRCKLRQGRDEITVAVKTLRNNTQITSCEQARLELLQEIDVMKSLGTHPNVVRLLYCCTSDSHSSQRPPVLLVMEFAELGNLQSYLKSSRLTHSYGTTALNSTYRDEPEIGSSDLSAGQQQLVARDLLKFIYHVAQGMEYISSLCILHRDLASRNILLSIDRICKIGDFGMARKVSGPKGFKEEELTYERSRDAKVPVRWMAPEVILSNQFTTSSDVYSFGVLMWEIVTLGSTPYTHLKTNQVIEEVAKRGERPEKPEYCHEQLYRIMSECWSPRPMDRPSFRELVCRLDQLLMSGEEYIQLDQYPDHDYYNIPQAAVPYEII